MSGDANDSPDVGAVPSGIPYARPYVDPEDPERRRPMSRVPSSVHVLGAIAGALVAGCGAALVAAAFGAPTSEGINEPYGAVVGFPLIVAGLVQLGISLGLAVRKARRLR